MGQLKSNSEPKGTQLFNSNLETGVRALIILNETYPKSFDLSTLTWLDYLVVHTGDIDGPESLHPNVPQRGGEVLVRRRLIENSLTLMRRLRLISTIHTEHGLEYQATDDAYPIVQLMRTKYATKLKKRAQWLSENICTIKKENLYETLSAKLGRWGIEFLEKNYLDKESK